MGRNSWPKDRFVEKHSVGQVCFRNVNVDVDVKRDSGVRLKPGRSKLTGVRTGLTGHDGLLPPAIIHRFGFRRGSREWMVLELVLTSMTGHRELPISENLSNQA